MPTRIPGRLWNGWTPLHFAARNGEPAVVQALLAAGADPNARTKDKLTSLHAAARYNENPLVVEALLAAGADPNARDKYKNTPLHFFAAGNGEPAVVQALLAAGADPNARDKYKNTPLHDAARYNENPLVIEALLAAGADPMARDKQDDTPLDDAEQAENITVVEVLRHPTTVRARQLAASSRNEDTEKRRQRGPGRTHSRRNGGRCRDCFRRQHGGHIGGRGSRGVQPADCHERGPTNRC